MCITEIWRNVALLPECVDIWRWNLVVKRAAVVAAFVTVKRPKR